MRMEPSNYFVLFERPMLGKLVTTVLESYVTLKQATSFMSTWGAPRISGHVLRLVYASSLENVLAGKFEEIAVISKYRNDLWEKEGCVIRPAKLVTLSRHA